MVDDLPVSRRRLRRPKPMSFFMTETGRSARTIRRYVAEPREDYEARSISHAAPWRAEGVSRATWYRRLKAARVQGKLT